VDLNPGRIEKGRAREERLKLVLGIRGHATGHAASVVSARDGTRKWFFEDGGAAQPVKFGPGNLADDDPGALQPGR